jgi:hypothetical protein
MRGRRSLLRTSLAVAVLFALSLAVVGAMRTVEAVNARLDDIGETRWGCAQRRRRRAQRAAKPRAGDASVGHARSLLEKDRVTSCRIGSVADAKGAPTPGAWNVAHDAKSSKRWLTLFRWAAASTQVEWIERLSRWLGARCFGWRTPGHGWSGLARGCGLGGGSSGGLRDGGWLGRGWLGRWGSGGGGR